VEGMTPYQQASHVNFALSLSKQKDPHRRSGCWFEKNQFTVPVEGEAVTAPDWHEPQPVENWFGLLDWAVYHAPGWREWQAFRASLVGTPMKHRESQIRKWWERSHTSLGENPALANEVRVVNLLRSLRGQFRRHPELQALLQEANRELNVVRGESK
jgi:hypothetical protein